MPTLQPLKSRSMMNVEQAITTAFNYIKSLPKSAGQFGGVRLEEIEEGKGAGRGKWLITISHTVPRDGEKMTNILGGLRLGRSYKVITVDGASGKVISMKIRTL